VISIVDIQDSLSSYYPSPDLSLIKRAYIFGVFYHKDQRRFSGAPYISHPLSVAKILTEFKVDDRTVAAGLLHDVAEDTSATLGEISRHFGSEVAFLVDGVTKLSRFELKSQDEKQAENLRRMLIFMAKDLRVILIKLADRLDNMRTVKYLPQESAQKMAQETLDIFSPIAHRLGIYWLKNEFEDIALSVLKPDIAKSIKRRLEDMEAYRERYIHETCQKLKNVLAKEGIKAQVQGRLKNIHSIYRKMLREGINLDELHDIVAFRIITSSVKECYEVLGIIHSYFKPIPGKFKDYIAMPKLNGYRSLHTTVIGERGHKMEIQIRDEKMHREAEEGISAHWIYKTGTQIPEKELARFSWIKSLLDISRKTPRSSDLLDEVKESLYPDEVYVFTPKGDIKVLPRGATVLDFAFAVHTELGELCVGAKVNSKLQSIDYELKNGDTIEVLTSRTQKPRRSWLNIARTQKARSRIKSFIRHEERETFIAIGEDTLRRELRRLRLRLEELLKQGVISSAATSLNLKSVEDLYALVGYGKLAPSVVLRAIKKEILKKDEESGEGEYVIKEKAETAESVALGDIMSRFAQCCNPVPGDRLVGYITRGKGIVIHNELCEQVKSLDPDRLVHISSTSFKLPEYGIAKVVVLAEQNTRVMGDIASILSKEGMKMEEANFKVENSRIVANIKIGVKNKSDIDKILKDIEKVEGVISASRDLGKPEF
jgi:GTP pyrophosphokinase